MQTTPAHRAAVAPGAALVVCTMLLTLAILPVTTASGLSAMVPIPGDPVATTSGLVSGTSLPGVRAYLGIPYARPPVQSLRWARPQTVHWDGLWNADRFGPECIQILRPHKVNHYFGEEPSGEDCLYLNIWAPERADTRVKLPVIVFLYGGGGTVGSSGMAVYRGDEVARHGALFVSFNYRIGILGFMAHPELSREQGGHSGNYGYLDQNAALTWVHDNIAAFGGDPAKVIITGQSFGAASVAAQLFSPLSKGLFRGAALWSACNFTADAVTLDTAEQTGSEIQRRLGAADLGALRDIAADKILALQEEHQLGANVSGLRVPPTIDGYFWPADKQSILASHRFNDVPFIAGSNGDDIDSNRSPLTTAATVAEFQELSRKMYGPAAGEFLKLFPVANDAAVPAAAHQAAAESGFLRDSQTCASLQSKYNTSAAYLELFLHKHPYAPGVQLADQDPVTVGAYHTADVPYWFGTFDAFNLFRATRQWTAADRALSDAMLGSLISLADTGNPGAGGVPWVRWAPTHQSLVVFGDTGRQEKLHVERMEWLAAHPAADVPRVVKPRTIRD